MLPFETFELANGLRVIVQEDPQVAKAAVDVVYRVGARDESPQRTGLAHLFEHLMFSGSVHIPDFDTHVQRAGGENNAFTNNDITNYYVTLPAAQLETALWLESDRMLGLDFSERNLAVQKSVVIEEFKQRYLNQPYGDAYLHLRPLHYQVHPYRWMTIGVAPEHVADASLDEIRDFFYGFYAPNNATLVVAGGVRTAEVERLARKYFGGIERRSLRKRPYPAEPPQTAPRHATVHAQVPHAAVYRAYHVPARAQTAAPAAAGTNGTPQPPADYYATDLLMDLLGSGKGSRLYQALVKDAQVASSVSAFSWGLYDNSMVSINAQVAEGRSVAEYEAALDAALAGLAHIPAAEVRRQQAKVESLDAFEKTEVANRATALAIYDSLGNPALLHQEVQNYLDLSPAQLERAAATYLRPDNCSTLYYLPQAGTSAQE